MSRTPNNRRDKIRLLRDIEAGRINVSELNIAEVDIDILDEQGIYHCSPTNSIEMNKEEDEAYKVKHPARLRILVVPIEGCDPSKER